MQAIFHCYPPGIKKYISILTWSLKFDRRSVWQSKCFCISPVSTH